MADSNRGDMRVDILDLINDVRDQILREMHAGFKGTHHRQDITNGRINGLEVKVAELDTRADGVDRALAQEALHLHRRSTDPPVPIPLPASKVEDGDERRLTQRDARLVLLGAAAALGLFKLLPWLVQLAHAGKP